MTLPTVGRIYVFRLWFFYGEYDIWILALPRLTLTLISMWIHFEIIYISVDTWTDQLILNSFYYFIILTFISIQISLLFISTFSCYQYTKNLITSMILKKRCYFYCVLDTYILLFPSLNDNKTSFPKPLQKQQIQEYHISIIHDYESNNSLERWNRNCGSYCFELSLKNRNHFKY